MRSKIKRYLMYISILFVIFMFINVSCVVNAKDTIVDKDIIFQNYGITHSHNVKELYITIDMCPSSKVSMEERLFLALIELSKQRKEPINIAIAISGLWAKSHEKELSKIINWERKEYFKITWVNHSYRHYYNSDLPFEQNFMIHDLEAAKADIIENKTVLSKYGIELSNYFRFPGLISNDYLNNLVEKEMHLKILGARTWLVKTSGKFSGGDIILLHGNGNEPKGIEIFLTLLKAGLFDQYDFAAITNL